MKNTTIRLGASLLFASMFSLYGQSENFEITSETIPKIQYVKVYPVTHSEVPDASRQADFIETAIDNTQLVGSYELQMKKYRIARGDDPQGKFVTNELIDPSIESMRVTELTYALLIRHTDGKKFVMLDRDVQNVQKERQIQKTIEAAKSMGFEPFKDGQDYYVKSKTSEIRLDERTLMELKKDPNYIITLDADQAKIAALVQQTKPHIKVLNDYLGIYRIKRSKTPVATLTSWKKATANAQKLADQIYKLNEKYDGNYSFKLLNRGNTYDVFLDNLNASKGALGM